MSITHFYETTCGICINMLRELRDDIRKLKGNIDLQLELHEGREPRLLFERDVKREIGRGLTSLEHTIRTLHREGCISKEQYDEAMKNIEKMRSEFKAKNWRGLANTFYESFDIYRSQLYAWAIEGTFLACKSYFEKLEKEKKKK